MFNLALHRSSTERGVVLAAVHPAREAMRAKDERALPTSCMNRAREDEMTFVLLGRDASAPVAIREWVNHRIATGKNTPDDQQIIEALACADTMERENVR